MANTKSIIETKLLIIGSGPAGYSAAIYAARAALEPTLITGMQPGGQLTITTEVENYPGFAEAVQGPWLMQQMEAQAKNVGTNIVYDHVDKVDLSSRPYGAITAMGNEYKADQIIISTGAQAKWLGLESEKHFQGFGVSGCATCDGFFFKNKEVAVIGGGNTAVEEALFLTNHASKVYLIHRRDSLRAEKVLQERLFSHPKVNIIWDHVVEEIIGKENPKEVTALKLKSTKNNSMQDVLCEGVFIAIGHKPNTSMFEGQIDIDEEGYIVTSPNSTRVKKDGVIKEGVFACGDVQDKIYRQAVTAAGTGCMAALEAQKS